MKAIKEMNVFSKFLRWCPGAVGLVLRQKIYPKYFKTCGRGVIFGRFLDITHARKIILGNHVVLNHRVCLTADEHNSMEQAIILEDGVFVGEGTLLQSCGAPLRIQSGANLSSCCRITAFHPLTIGRKVLVASYCSLGNNENQEQTEYTAQNTNHIHIGDGCWLGVRTQILSGVSIGEGTIIGAHSLVNRDLPARAVCFGQPAAKWSGR